MKILMVARRFPPDIRSGTETVFDNLWRRARERHQVRLVVGYRRDRSLVPAEAVAVDLRQGSLAARYLRLWEATAREIRRYRPDVVLSNSIEVPVLGVPTVCIVHDVNFGRSGRDLGTVGRLLYYRLKTRRFHRVVTVSEAMRRELVAAGLDGQRVVAIRNGVDLARFTPPAAAPGADPLVLCYPSRILPGKGQHVAVDAVARLTPEEKARVALRIVGTVADPAYIARLEVQARGQPVTFHLEVPDIVPWYQEAGAILFPTLMGEGFGFTAVEGMACGRPVAWTDQPAIREATGGIGLPFPQGDAPALREAIRTLLRDPALRERVGQQGRSFVEGHYDWRLVWSRYEDLLLDVSRSRP